MPWVSCSTSLVSRYRLCHSVSLTYFEIKHAQWKQNMASVSPVDKVCLVITRFVVLVGCPNQFQANIR